MSIDNNKITVEKQFLEDIVSSIKFLDGEEGFPEGSSLPELMIKAKNYLNNKK